MAKRLFMEDGPLLPGIEKDPYVEPKEFPYGSKKDGTKNTREELPVKKIIPDEEESPWDKGAPR